MSYFSRAFAALFLILIIPSYASGANDCSWSVDLEGVNHLNDDCTTDMSYGLTAGVWDLDGHMVNGIDPMGDHFRGGVLEFLEDGVHVRNGVVTTTGLANICDGGDDRLRGIYSNGYGGSVVDMTVIGVNQGPSGCQEGIGIEFRNIGAEDYVDALVENCSIVDYQKGGVVFNGLVNVEISGCTIEGGGMIGSIAQNGIQAGYGARGQANNNLVDGNWYTGSSWTSSGILVFESDDFHVVNNTVRENQSGLVVEVWNWFEASASRNHFTNNEVLESLYGVTASAYILGGYSMGDALCTQNRIQNNTIENAVTDGEIGVYLGGGYYFGGDEDDGLWVNSRNRVVNNEICGFDTGVLDEGEGNRLHRNTECSDEGKSLAVFDDKIDLDAIWVEPYL